MNKLSVLRATLVAISLLALAVLVVLYGKPRKVHAASLSPYTLTAAGTSGFVIVSPVSGLMTYCPATKLIEGQTVTQEGACITLAGARPTPTTDPWTITAIPNYSTTLLGGSSSADSFFMLDRANGTILNCAVVYTVISAANIDSTGNCANWGTAPQ